MHVSAFVLRHRFSHETKEVLCVWTRAVLSFGVQPGTGNEVEQ